MTTNANKHGLRAAAAERSKKHAQRTPLPPRAGVVEAARMPVDLNLRTERGATAPDAKSAAKAAAFLQAAVAAGWTGGTAQRGEATELTLTRGPETIVQAWANGVWQYDASVYAFADRTTKPRNASGAQQLLTRSPEMAQEETAKVAGNNAFRKREPKSLSTIVLPLDPELLTDEEAAKYFRGRTIRWYNRWTRGAETATVSRASTVTVKRYGDEVTIAFCCPVTGFRAFHLSAVLAVGRGKAVETDAAAVELLTEDAA